MSSLAAGGSFLDGGEAGVLPCGLLAFGRRVDLPLRRRRKDSLSDFLKDFRREIGVSPAPVRSKRNKIEYNADFFLLKLENTDYLCKNIISLYFS